LKGNSIKQEALSFYAAVSAMSALSDTAKRRSDHRFSFAKTTPLRACA
jgi:hypothetical protein